MGCKLEGFTFSDWKFRNEQVCLHAFAFIDSGKDQMGGVTCFIYAEQKTSVQATADWSTELSHTVATKE